MKTYLCITCKLTYPLKKFYLYNQQTPEINNDSEITPLDIGFIPTSYPAFKIILNKLDSVAFILHDNE